MKSSKIKVMIMGAPGIPQGVYEILSQMMNGPTLSRSDRNARKNELFGYLYGNPGKLEEIAGGIRGNSMDLIIIDECDVAIDPNPPKKGPSNKPWYNQHRKSKW